VTHSAITYGPIDSMDRPVVLPTASSLIFHVQQICSDDLRCRTLLRQHFRFANDYEANDVGTQNPLNGSQIAAASNESSTLWSVVKAAITKTYIINKSATICRLVPFIVPGIIKVFDQNFLSQPAAKHQFDPTG